MTGKIRVYCPCCKGTDVVRDAWAAFNEETQAWELSSVFDQGYCNTCEGEQTLEDEPLTEA